MKYTDLKKYSLERLQALLEEHYRSEVVLDRKIKQAIERIIKFKQSNT